MKKRKRIKSIHEKKKYEEVGQLPVRGSKVLIPVRGVRKPAVGGSEIYR